MGQSLGKSEVSLQGFCFCGRYLVFGRLNLRENLWERFNEKWGFAAFMMLFLGFAGFYWDDGSRNRPLFINMQQEWEQVAGEKFITDFHNLDTLLDHQLYLLTDNKDQPLMFYADILTPVCIDGICKPVYIELYWNLTGSYAGFGLYPDRPLTKYDHDEFTEEDYRKMHRLLSDAGSVLSRRTLSELFDENAEPQKKIEYQGVELDAVSGATVKEIKDSVVEGALYSCYTLWHLVHGKVTRHIEGYLQSVYSAALQGYFLDSDYEDYWFYALRQMEEAELAGHYSRVAEIFQAGKPLTRAYILKKFPKSELARKEISEELYRTFSSVDLNAKTLLVNNLPHAHGIALEILSAQVEAMSKNQLKAFLRFLPADETRIPSTVRENLQKAAASQTFVHAYLLTQFLD